MSRHDLTFTHIESHIDDDSVLNIDDNVSATKRSMPPLYYKFELNIRKTPKRLDTWVFVFVMQTKFFTMLATANKDQYTKNIL